MLDTLPQVPEKDIEHGMRAIRMFYQIGNHMRKIVDRHAAQPFFLQQSYGLAKIGSAIFQIATGRPIVAMTRCSKAAMLSPVQVSATETATQLTCCNEGAPALHAYAWHPVRGPS